VRVWHAVRPRSCRSACVPHPPRNKTELSRKQVSATLFQPCGSEPWGLRVAVWRCHEEGKLQRGAFDFYAVPLVSVF
jgi:hypothetical protein